MTQKEKGYVGLGVMLVLAAGTVLGSEPLYKAIDSIAAGSVSYEAGTYTGTAQGFGGTVTATVTVTGSGIESVELKGDSETPEIGGAALEKLGSAFVEAGTAKVDAVAGATISSDAAIEAVGQALKEALGEADAKADTQKEAQAAPADVSYKAGTYEGSGKGFGGDVKAVVTITDAGIESVELTGDDETPELGGAALEKLQDMFVSAQSADIDGVSGCTLTSDGAIEAVQAALDQAQ